MLACAAGAWALAEVLTGAPLPREAAPAWPEPAADAAMPPVATPWPALFGSPPALGVDPEVETAAAPPAPPPRPEARLRGLAVDEGGGWALIETAAGVALLRPGAMLDADHRVVAIAPSGVTLDGPGGPWALAFADTPAPAPSESRPRPGLAQTLLGGTRYFYDGGGLPMPLPPEGFQSGPGPTAGDNL